ncbi:MAG: TonB-dependent receptor [Dysgonamonadaceae bacterium]|jgi:outer membrane receptor protein involved in Fe transport|nr:TonB-dependent receptor [Dysgonamonadaceae bacterium]
MDGREYVSKISFGRFEEYMNKPHIIILTLNLLFSVTVSSQSDSLKAKDVILNEVVVQSFKYGSNSRNILVATTTINNEDLQNRQAVSTKDFALFTPNMFAPDYGSRLTSPVYIRGIGSKINSPSIGLYVDGIPYFEKSAFDFDINEAESIKILRGPQGTLYGRNTMGGIIDIHTRSPLNHKGTNVSASAGSYGYLGGQFSHYDSNTDNNFGYAVSGNTTHSDGYFINEYDGRKADAFNSSSLRARFDWRLHPNLTAKLTSTLDYLSQGGYPYGVIDSTGKTTAPNYDGYSSYDRTMISNGLSVIYLAENFSINSQTAYQYLKDKQNIDQDFSPKATYFVVQNQKQATFSQEFTVKSESNKPYKWLLGASAFYQHIDTELITNYIADNYSSNKLYDTPTKGVSIYHQSTFDELLNDALSLSFGVRYDYEQASDNYVAYRDTTGRSDKTDFFFSRLDFGQITPKASLKIAVTENKMLYASVAKGYKTGGFNTSFLRDEDRSFKPEHSWNYETGFKGDFLDGLLQIDACLFYIDWRNQQIYQPLPVISGQRYIGGQMLTNAGHSSSKGLEVSLQIKPARSLNIRADWGYTRAVFKEYQRNDTTNYAGNAVPFAPRHTVSAGFDYTLKTFAGQIDKLILSMNYQGIDKIYWNDENSSFQSYYGLLNGKITAAKGSFTVSLWAKNITNADYSAYYFESQGKRFAQKGKPFTLGTTFALTL